MEILYWNEKVEKFIRDQDDITSVRIEKTIDLLEKYGHLIGMPDSKSLSGGLFELRTSGKKQVRIMYVFHKNKAYIIHIFVKKTWKISNKDLEYGRRTQKEVIRLA